MSQIIESTDLSSDCVPPSEGAGTVFYISAGLLFLAGAAATIYFCHTMSGGMDMPGGWTMSMMWMRMPGQSWPAAAASFMLMWAAMMVAMMLPSALPVFCACHIAQRRGIGRRAMFRTPLVVVGYFVVWSAVGLVIYIPGIAFALAAMQWTALSRITPRLLALIVIIAGVMQFMPWTRAALNRCHGPFACNARLQNESGVGAFRAGLQYGGSCLVCCAGPTLILLALGMMNPVVILLVAAIIALEKLMPWPQRIASGVGGLAVLTGLMMLFRAGN